MPTLSTRTYNPKTGKWTKSTTKTKESNTLKNVTKTATKTSKTGGNSSSKSGNSSKKSSAGKTEKKLRSKIIRTLEGSISYIATQETIKLRAGDTVRLKGIGINLSRDYYVKDITRTINSSGYSHTATVINNDAGTSLKIKTINANKKLKKTKVAVKKHKVKKGDTLWTISKKYYGSTVLHDKIYKENKEKIGNNPKRLKVGIILSISKPTDKELYKVYVATKGKNVNSVFIKSNSTKK